MSLFLGIGNPRLSRCKLCTLLGIIMMSRQLKFAVNKSSSTLLHLELHSSSIPKVQSKDFILHGLKSSGEGPRPLRINCVLYIKCVCVIDGSGKWAHIWRIICVDNFFHSVVKYKRANSFFKFLFLSLSLSLSLSNSMGKKINNTFVFKKIHSNFEQIFGVDFFQS